MVPAVDGLEPEPAGAVEVFGEHLDRARQFVVALSTTAVERGLIGPREVPRLWARHVLNCAVVAELVPTGSRIADIGSGAGLPGLALAIARPDLRVTLVEPLQRRVIWLEETVADLGLGHTVEVRRCRAEELAGADFDVATARAVAALGSLVGWTAPAVRVGGAILALKGRNAEQELDEADAVLSRYGVTGGEVLECGGSLLEVATRVVCLRVGQRTPPRRGRGRRR